MRASEIAQLLGAIAHGDGEREIRGVAALESAGPDDLTFAEDERALERAAASRAGCILVGKDAPPELAARLAGRTIAVSHPKLAFIRATEALRSAARPA